MFPTVTPTTEGVVAPTLHREERQELTLRPGLFVGSGGTGHLILLYLKAIFLWLLGDLPPWVRIVVFDTAEENLSVSIGGHQVALERDSEFRYIGRVPVAGIIQHINNHPTIRERLPQIANLPPLNLLDGAGQIRPLGLLALLWHIDTVKQALQDPLWELAHRENLGILDGMRIDASRGINTFVVGSLCGGTGSGQFLDLAYLIRSLLEALGDLADYSEIIGLGVLPDAFRNVHGPNLIPNTVAALHELDHCMVQGGFKATYRNGHVVDTVHPPFNIYYLLSAVSEDSHTQLSHNELCWMAALGLYHLAMSPIGEREKGILVNQAEVLTRRTDDGHGTFFASFGLAELSFPAKAVATWCAYRHTQAVIRQGLLSTPADGDAQRAWQAAIQTHIQTQKLTLDALLQRLAVDDTGIPLAVELQPPAHIQDAEPHTVPQLAVQYVQTFRRERVDGDYRIWVEENAQHHREELQETLSALTQEIMDDAGRGLRFAHAFAQGIGKHLEDLAATATARQKALQAESKILEERMEQARERLFRAPKANWFSRRQVIQEALSEYFDTAQDFLQARLDLLVLEQAIAVVVAVQQLAESWTREIEAILDRLQTVDGELEHRQRRLTDELLHPTRTSGMALVDQAYLDHLYQTYAPEVSATLDALLADESQAPHRWTTCSQEELQAILVRVAARPFEPIRQMSIEQVIQERSDYLTPRQWAETLLRKARPAWNLNEVLLPEETVYLARIELLGVPNRERSIYANNAARLVSTLDPHRITAFVLTAGAPFTALRRYPDYLRAYQRVRGSRPLHVLPAFLTEGENAKLAFALGHLFGFITNRVVYYYYQPADELAEPIQLGKGRENAIQALGSRTCTEPGRSDGLVHEVMQRVEEHIEDIGFDQAEQKLAAFYAVTGQEDHLTRELKRLVRDYAEQLRKHRLS